MSRAFALPIAVVCYAAFFVSFVYLIGFTAAFEQLPVNVDKGPASSLGAAVAIDLALIALFGVQHSVMARPAFKAWWTRVVPVAVERSIYCLAAALCLAALFAFWRPIAGTIWLVETPGGRLVSWGLFLLGWTILFVATWLISHFELFGIAQAWRNARGTEAGTQAFRTPFLYRWVRHPIYTGVLLAFWATPHMTYGHLLFAVGFSAYIFIGIAHEERDLVAHFGEDYARYRQKVGMVVPGLGRRAG